MQKLLILLITLFSSSLTYGMESNELPETIHLISETTLGVMLVSYNPHKAPEGSSLEIRLSTIPQITLNIPKPIIVQTPLGTIAHLSDFDISCIEYQRTKDNIVETASFMEELKMYSGGSCNLQNKEIKFFNNEAEAREKFNQFKAAFEAAQRK